MNSELDEVIFTWGKFKGNTLGNVLRTSPQYLQWIASTPAIPDVWVEAAKRALNGQDISDLSLPKTKLSAIPQKIQDAKSGPIKIFLKDKKAAYLVMPYNKLLIEKFKYEIDGRAWNAEDKRWEFPAVHLPKIVKLFPNAQLTDDAIEKLLELQARRMDLDEIRENEDTSFNVPNMKLELYNYQRLGVQFIDRANGRCMVADEPGLGKTAQAIAYAHLHKLRTIIVCPLSVVINWQREIQKFVGQSSTVWDAKTYDGMLTNNFHVTHYEAVSKNHHLLREQKFDLLVCDEATYLKNRKTIRAKCVLGSWKERIKYPGLKTKYVLFLTGTPVMSRPIEAFSLLSYLDKERFSNFYHFVQRYGGWKGQAPMNLLDLHDRTKDLVIRRQMSSVFKEFPLKQRNDLYVELTIAEQKEYDELLREMFGKWRVDRKPSIQHMPKLQAFLIDKKMPRLIEMIDEYLDNDKSILIFSCYLAPLKKLLEHYGKQAALLTGEMSRDARQETIDKLVNKVAKIGLVSLRAGGMGIDGLQHAINTVVFVDIGWLPAEHHQAENRAHRLGQKFPVQAYYMMCADTIDEHMRDVLKEKQAIADIIVDGSLVTPENNKSMFKEFVKRISKQYNEKLYLESITD